MARDPHAPNFLSKLPRRRGDLRVPTGLFLGMREPKPGADSGSAPPRMRGSRTHWGLSAPTLDPAVCSLLEVGQVEELEAPVTLDGAVDEDHVVDCRAGPISAGPASGPPPPTSCPGPPPTCRPRPPPTRTSWDQQQEARHEEDGAGNTCGRAGGVGSGQGGSRAGSPAGSVPGKSPSPRSKGPFPAGKVLTAGGGGRACQGPLVHERGVSAACRGRRGGSPGEGATSSPTPVRISTAHKCSREGEGRRRRRQKLVAGWGPPPATPPHGLGLRNGVPT